MSKIKQGSQVKVHYKGILTDGKVFDQSSAEAPLSFTIGESQIIPGFEKAVTEMEVGESRTIEIPAEEAYGPHREELVGTVSRNRLPEDLTPQIGQMLQIGEEQGQKVLVQVVAINDDQVTLDGNHPLAGQDLTFQIELLEAC